MKKIFYILLIYLSISVGYSQCMIDIASTDGYNVHIELSEFNLNNPISCNSGYDYTIDLDYQISFTGTNIPDSLLTLTGSLNCIYGPNSFELPNKSGSGIITTNKEWNPLSDCNYATPSNLGCLDNISINIEGSGIVNQNIGCNKALPINLIYLSAIKREKSVYISWATASELNNDYFIIQKSIDINNWENIGIVNGNGTINETSHYYYIDEKPNKNISYYRIVQYDYNGYNDYSNIKTVFIDPIELLNIVSNPFNENIYIIDNENINFRTFDVLGKDVTNLIKVEKIDDLRVSLDFSLVPNGIYILNTKRSNIRIIKK